MLEFFVFFLPVGENTVGCNGDGFDLLDVSRVFPNLVFGKGCLVEKLLFPLPQCHGVGDKYEGLCLKDIHNPYTDDGFPRTAGEHDNTVTPFGATTTVKCFYRALLVITYGELFTVWKNIL